MQNSDQEPHEETLETVPEFDTVEDELEGTPTVMPWVLPVIVIVGFFAFVALPVYLMV